MKTKFGCSGKMFWSTQSEARTYHKRIKFKGSDKKGPIRFYKCRYENHWHMSSMSRTEFKTKGFYKHKLKRV